METGPVHSERRRRLLGLFGLDSARRADLAHDAFVTEVAPALTRVADTDDDTFERDDRPYVDEAREKTVVAGLAKALSDDELARALELDEADAQSVISQVLGKLGAYDRADAIVRLLADGRVGWDDLGQKWKNSFRIPAPPREKLSDAERELLSLRLAFRSDRDILRRMKLPDRRALSALTKSAHRKLGVVTLPEALRVALIHREISLPPLTDPSLFL